MQRKTRLNHRSAKTAKTYRTQRAPLVAELLQDNPPCQRCTTARADDVHEIKSRARGGSILDRDNLALLCRPCHRWVTDNPAAAHAEGWTKHSWE